MIKQQPQRGITADDSHITADLKLEEIKQLFFMLCFFMNVQTGHRPLMPPLQWCCLKKDQREGP